MTGGQCHNDLSVFLLFNQRFATCIKLDHKNEIFRIYIWQRNKVSKYKNKRPMGLDAQLKLMRFHMLYSYLNHCRSKDFPYKVFYWWSIQI